MVEFFRDADSFSLTFFRESLPQIIHYDFPAVANAVIDYPVNAIRQQIKDPHGKKRYKVKQSVKKIIHH